MLLIVANLCCCLNYVNKLHQSDYRQMDWITQSAIADGRILARIPLRDVKRTGTGAVWRTLRYRQLELPVAVKIH